MCVPLILSSLPLREPAAPLGSSRNLQYQMLLTLVTLLWIGCAGPNTVLPQYFTGSYLTVKGKGTVHFRTGHERSEGKQMYNSTLSLTSALR